MKIYNIIQNSGTVTRKMLEHWSGRASMKGKMKGERKKERRGKKKRRAKKKKFHSRARTRDFPLYSQLPRANAWGRIARPNVLNRHISQISIVMNWEWLHLLRSLRQWIFRTKTWRWTIKTQKYHEWNFVDLRYIPRSHCLLVFKCSLDKCPFSY